MRPIVRALVEAATQTLPLDGPIYEFGSFQVDGQQSLANLRPLFPGRDYVGCDMRPGPGVDRIEDLAALKLENGAAGSILCLDTLEHVFECRQAVKEMLRVLGPGGCILITVPLDFHIHAHPDDYWRMTPSCLSQLLSACPLKLVGWQGEARYPHTVFAAAIKPPAAEDAAERVSQFAGHLMRNLKEPARIVGWKTKLRRLLMPWLRTKGERRKEAALRQLGIHIQATDTALTASKSWAA